MSTSFRVQNRTLLRLNELKPFISSEAPKSNDAALSALMNFFESHMILAVVGGERRYFEDDATTKHLIQKRYPEAAFSGWQENNEPEAKEGEEVMYAMIGDDIIAALYQNRWPMRS
jgi:hypothetical protein